MAELRRQQAIHGDGIPLEVPNPKPAAWSPRLTSRGDGGGGATKPDGSVRQCFTRLPPEVNFDSKFRDTLASDNA